MSGRFLAHRDSRGQREELGQRAALSSLVRELDLGFQSPHLDASRQFTFNSVSALALRARKNSRTQRRTRMPNVSNYSASKEDSWTQCALQRARGS